ncbi:cysteine-rich secretory family protein [Paraburkholderia sp. BL8N3]|nr:CAP domain-containing protein [Paraburkholderia sp. BL8N3]TCK33433.1 cysteine-rich secretory family protein [Paraburkholderia sp. BL8N3]
MKTSSTLRFMALAVAASFVVAACGGGGGGDSGSSAPATPPAAPASGGIPPQTSVPAPTYAADSFQAAAFALVNNYRSAMGVGMLRQDVALDTSAQAHAAYLFSNLKSGAITALDHNETAGNANYYGDTPLSRAQKAGAPITQWVGENVAAGVTQATNTAAAADCMGQALASVYHLAGLTANQESIGLGFNPGDASYPIYTCVSDFGTSSGVMGAPSPNAIPFTGGQVIPLGVVVHSPYANEAGVALAMRAESPNPAADLSSPGRPILVSVNAQNADNLTVTQFTLSDNSGVAVAARILVPASAKAGSTATTVADPNSLLPNGTAVLLPEAPLKANTTYTVTFSGARDGSALSSTWSFSTGAN